MNSALQGEGGVWRQQFRILKRTLGASLCQFSSPISCRVFFCFGFGVLYCTSKLAPYYYFRSGLSSTSRGMQGITTLNYNNCFFFTIIETVVRMYTCLHLEC